MESNAHQLSHDDEERSEFHAMLEVGRAVDGSTHIRRVNGTKWNVELLDRVREAADMVNEEMMNGGDFVQFTKTKTDSKKLENWWPDELKCGDCGMMIRIVSEPRAYVMDCPHCNATVMIYPVR